MNFFKGILKRDDDNIPEMKLNKNDVKPYYNKELKCWMIPGEEEAKKKELEAAKKGPPKRVVSNANSSGGNRVGQGRGRPIMANRYASALPTDNIAEERVVPEINKEESPVDSAVSSNVNLGQSPSLRESQIREPDNMNNTLFYSVQENINNTEVAKNEDKDNNNISGTANNSPHQRNIATEKVIAPSTPAINIREIEEKIRKQMEEEYEQKLLSLESNLNNQISELREALQLSEETAEEEQVILKNQLNSFIKENLELKLENEKMQDDLSFKHNEIEQYQNLLDNYRKTVDETRELSEKVTPNSLDTSRSDDYILINTRIEKLEYDKLNLTNELIESKREISSLSLDKSILEYKLKEIENCHNANVEKMKENILDLEQKNMSLEMQNKVLQKNKEALERESKRAEELAKHNEDILSKLNESNEELSKLKQMNGRLSQENKTSTQLNNHLKSEILKLKNSLEEKDLNYTKVIKDLRLKMNEYKSELEKLREEKDAKFIDPEAVKEFEMKINDNNEKIFNQEKLISQLANNLDIVREYIIEQFKFITQELDNGDADKLTQVVNKLSEIGVYELDKEICIAFKSMSNEFINRKYEKTLASKEKSLLDEEIKNLQIEVEILKDVKEDMTLEIEKLKDTINETNVTEERLKSQIRDRDGRIARLEEEIDISRSTNTKASVEEVEKLNSEIVTLEGRITDLKTSLKFESSETARLQGQVSYLQNQVDNLNEEIKALNENYFNTNFTNEKIIQELKSRNEIVEYIINDVDSTLLSGQYTLHESEISEEQETFIEAKLANKVKSLKNLLEKYKNESTLVSNELTFYKEDNSRKVTANNFLENEINTIKSKLVSIEQENTGMNNEKSELLANIQHLNSEVQNLKNQNNFIINSTAMSNSEILSEKDKEIEYLKEKTFKLKELLDNTKTHYEEGIEGLKNKQKQKLASMKERIEELESENSVLKQGSDAKLQDILTEKEKLRENLNSLHEMLEEKSKIEENLNKTIRDHKATIDKLNQEIKEKGSVSTSQLSSIKSDNEELSKKVSLLEKEQEVLIENINEKNREINELKNTLSELETHIEKLKTSYDEATKNYEFLLKNHKSAEKLNEFQKKIQHQLEEKATVKQSNDLIVENLTNEIKSLNEELNRYKKKEINLFEETTVKPKKEESPIDIKPQSPKKLTEISLEKPRTETLSQQTPITPTSQEQRRQQQQQLGFFSKFIAPIFLTEKDLEKMHSDNNK